MVVTFHSAIGKSPIVPGFVFRRAFLFGRCGVSAHLTNTVLHAMPKSRDLGMPEHNCAAHGAAHSAGMTGLVAGRLLTRQLHKGVPPLRYGLPLRQHLIANRAVRSLGQSFLLTGRCHSGILDLGVSLRRDLFCLGRVANRAGIGLYTRIFAGGFGRNYAVIPLVPLCGNLFRLGIVADRACLRSCPPPRRLRELPGR